mmetsp:Transcript_29086/g.76773  ORF Transcript_29086/g.76773 Transcript_29086/m.76773 type:complete len:230 (-) Transcript_29086:174-863(-)
MTKPLTRLFGWRETSTLTAILIKYRNIASGGMLNISKSCPSSSRSSSFNLSKLRHLLDASLGSPSRTSWLKEPWKRSTPAITEAMCNSSHMTSLLSGAQPVSNCTFLFIANAVSVSTEKMHCLSSSDMKAYLRAIMALCITVNATGTKKTSMMSTPHLSKAGLKVKYNAKFAILVSGANETVTRFSWQSEENRFRLRADCKPRTNTYGMVLRGRNKCRTSISTNMDQFT